MMENPSTNSLDPLLIARSLPGRYVKVKGTESSDVAPQPALLKFVMTGGPCAGKTTAMDSVSAHFKDKGFRVFTVPEVATLLFNNGISYLELSDPLFKFSFQWSLLRTQMQLEDSFERVARATGKPSVLLCDRGLMDGAAYIDREDWDRLTQANGLDELTLRDERYDAVFHLVTAAVDAEEFYTLENNVARSESPAEARIMDERTQLVWMGHPLHFLFDNSTGFSEKIQRIVSAASRVSGLPIGPPSIARAYVLQGVPRLDDPDFFPVTVRMFETEKIFLSETGMGRLALSLPPGSGGSGEAVSSHAFLLKRKKIGRVLSSHSVTRVWLWEDGSRSTVERVLLASEHDEMANDGASTDSSRVLVHQQVARFIWKGQSFSVEVYLSPAGGPSVLQWLGEGGGVSLPPFLSILRPMEEDDMKNAYQLSIVDGLPESRLS
ncbi:unnamed protein product [Choristocarpus tenellus]